MSWSATERCFHCGQIIQLNDLHVYAQIRHHFKDDGTRDSDRNFHRHCFEMFEKRGRPHNPEGDYEVLTFEEVTSK